MPLAAMRPMWSIRSVQFESSRWRGWLRPLHPAACAKLARTTAMAVRAYQPSVTVLASGDVLQIRTDAPS